MSFMIVLLPLPDVPTNATHSPGAMTKLIPLSTYTLFPLLGYENVTSLKVTEPVKMSIYLPVVFLMAGLYCINSNMRSSDPIAEIMAPNP